MNLTDEQIQKLPKWAQHHITSLEGQVAHLRKIQMEGPTNTDTTIEHFTEPPTLLQPGTRIRFRLADGAFEYIDARKIETDEVEIMASRPLRLRFNASNVVRIGVDN